MRSHEDNPLRPTMHDALGWLLFLGAVGAFCFIMLGFSWVLARAY